MSRRWFTRAIGLPLLLLLGVAYPQARPEQAGSTGASAPSAEQQAVLNKYCAGCHNSRAKVGGLALDALNLQAAADSAEIWEKALRKLRGHSMPPPGSPQPAQKEVDSFVAWMENTLV